MVFDQRNKVIDAPDNLIQTCEFKGVLGESVLYADEVFIAYCDFLSFRPSLENIDYFENIEFLDVGDYQMSSSKMIGFESILKLKKLKSLGLGFISPFKTDADPEMWSKLKIESLNLFSTNVPSVR